MGRGVALKAAAADRWLADVGVVVMGVVGVSTGRGRDCSVRGTVVIEGGRGRVVGWDGGCGHRVGLLVVVLLLRCQDGQLLREGVVVGGSGHRVSVRLVGGVESGRGRREGAYGHGDSVAGGRVCRLGGLLAWVDTAHLGVAGGRSIRRGPGGGGHGVEQVGRARVVVAEIDRKESDDNPRSHGWTLGNERLVEE